jgi:gamma-glutamylcyclotransferase (GGCT)/AIG2-like uncharacterized protein YtfP
VSDADLVCLLFVYGSLRSEFDNRYARLLRENAESKGHATVAGSIFRIGKYPGFRQEPDGIVHGELWKLREPVVTLAALDDYEGSEYSRVIVNVEMPQVKAWIYVYKGPVHEGQRIQSGDFLVP